MLLDEVLERLKEIPDDFTIFVRGDDTPLALSSPALVLSPIFGEETTLQLSDGTYRYLLEVGLAEEAIAVFARWSGLGFVGLSDQLRAVVHYADHDAYLPIDGAL